MGAARDNIMSDRLFEQPTVKVLPTDEGVSHSNSGKSIKDRKKLSDMDLSNLPPPPTISLSSLSDSDSNLTTSFSSLEIKDVDKQSSVKEDNLISDEQISVPVVDTTPSYANSLDSGIINPKIDSMLKKQDEEVDNQKKDEDYSISSPPSSEQSNSNNNIPSYAQVPSNYNQQVNSSISTSEDSIPSYARVPPSNLEPRKVQPPVIRTPVSIPARPDYLAYHGPKTSQSSIPIPSIPATNWMNVYQTQSADELFVLQQWFESVDQDRSGEIDSDELAAALNAAGDAFDRGTIALMIKIFDIDRNGNIDFNEFTKLFKYINVMRQSFDSFDINKCGVLDEIQTRNALYQAKYLFQKPNTRGLTFEQFMQMAIFLGNLRTLFSLHDQTNTGSIQLNEEEFVLIDCAQYV